MKKHLSAAQQTALFSDRYRYVVGYFSELKAKGRMMTPQEAEAIYDAGKETVVGVLLSTDARIRALE